MQSRLLLFAFVSMLVVNAVRAASAATVPTGFTDAVVASGLNTPTAMALAPDGRIFVCKQGGALRVIKNGALTRLKKILTFNLRLARSHGSRHMIALTSGSPLVHSGSAGASVET